MKYREFYPTLGAKAQELAREVFRVDQLALDLRKKYFDELSYVVSPKTAARFLQIERRLGQLVDVQLASSSLLAEVTGYGPSADMRDAVDASTK